MKALEITITSLIVGSLALSSCKKEDTETAPTPTQDTKAITLDLTGLEDLGPDYKYEGWLLVNGTPKSAGIFSVDASGIPSQSVFSLATADVNAATAYIISIEPTIDNDPAPSDVKIIAGDFNGTTANLAITHAAALGNDFSQSTGGYILATPTDGGMMDDENSGVWFLDPAAGPGASLNLPTLPTGWKYEGWAVINGTPISTGTFTSTTGTDEAAPYSATLSAGPAFPGEDFLQNAPMGLTFPVDLSEQTIVISVEPSPDNSPNPFTLKPLVGNVPTSATDHVLYSLNNNSVATNPTGTVNR